MSAESHGAGHAHQAPTGFIRKYVFSLDHKVIGIQYIVLALAAVLVGMTMSVLMRLNLSWPGTNWPILGTLFPGGAPGGLRRHEPDGARAGRRRIGARGRVGAAPGGSGGRGDLEPDGGTGARARGRDRRPRGDRSGER